MAEDDGIGECEGHGCGGAAVVGRRRCRLGDGGRSGRREGARLVGVGVVDGPQAGLGVDEECGGARDTPGGGAGPDAYLVAGADPIAQDIRAGAVVGLGGGCVALVGAVADELKRSVGAHEGSG
ncbi:hypothetical protein ACIQMV_33950 [Streptomyces sp. NPDC091412]|uniref:hypothetical protein n=1 Tax=Streptomyces sp. NPDC091412 TaxID=3366002 RepID=UPI003808458A